MDSKNPTKGSTWKVAIGAAVVLAACWSTSAGARTQAESDCNEIARDLQKLEAPVEPLTITNVDHVTIAPNAADLANSEPEASSGDESATPLLKLTPRVNNALRDIFDERREAEETSLELPTSPLAETEEIPDISELPDDSAPASQGEDEIELPSLLQRRMFRTDI